MNPRAWLASTLARHIEARGELLAEWEDADEMAVPVSTLAAFAPLWRTEAEVEDVRVLAPVAVPSSGRAAHGALEAAIRAYLREHGEAQSTDIARALAHVTHVQPVRVRLATMWAEGKLIRVGKGRYRLA